MIGVKHIEMLGHGGDRKSEEIKSQDYDLKTRTEVAKVAGVHPNTVDNAKKALEIAPEKADAMIAGEISVSVYPRFSAHACAMMVSSFGCVYERVGGDDHEMLLFIAQAHTASSPVSGPVQSYRELTVHQWLSVLYRCPVRSLYRACVVSSRRGEV